MIFDDKGLPKENGASDRLDSARLAGIMTVFEFRPRVECSKYVVHNWNTGSYTYVRHPDERGELDFSRDQAMCLMAGLWRQWLNHLVSEKFIDGKDILTPSHMGHIRRCQGKDSSWIQDAWLWLDVLWACKVKPDAESNQLLSILMVADKKYLKFYLKNHPDWKKTIKDYWCQWRNEPDLADHMIKTLEEFNEQPRVFQPIQ